MKNVFTCLCAFFMVTASKAQLNYTFFATTGTYTPIAGGTITELQEDGSGFGETDEGFVNGIPIGFTFLYDGIPYSTISANSNGFASLKSFSPITDTRNYDYYTADLTEGPYSETNTRPVLAPLWDDLDVYSYQGIKYITTGIAPNQVFTLEWNDMYWDQGASSISISFQLRLFESSNVIEFHYQQKPGAVSSTAAASIGITGVGIGIGNFISLNNASASPTASSTIDTYTINTRPATNQIYRFSPPNAAPSLAAIGNQIINEFSTSTFQALGTDPNAGQTLTYSLANAPAGASINPVNGMFTWTPTEAQGPNVYNIKVRVSDNGNPVMFAERTVTITVNEANMAPVLAAIGSKSLNEGTSLSFGVTASDGDLPEQMLSFSLVGAPSGATINPATGLFSWTPTEAQGGNAYTFNIKVTDNASSPLSAEQPVTISVIEVNVSPVLADIGIKSVNELSNVTFTALANDSDLPTQSIFYSLEGAPSGATISSSTGVFTWTPTESQGPATYTFIVKATDNAVSPLASEKTATITVNEVNSVPVLTLIPNKTVNELNELVFSASANDPDQPAQMLSFSLIGAPPGATINENSGAFNWTPSELQGPNQYTFKIRVTDQVPGLPSQFAEQSVTVVVNEINVAPVLTAIGDKTVAPLSTLSFNSHANDPDKPSQQIAYSLTGTVPVGASINAITGAFSWTPTAAQASQIYRFGVRATDNGTPSLFAEEQVTVTVLATIANKAPVLTVIGSKTVDELTALSFTASATDADAPAQSLTYSLIGAPVGATINATTGAFNWTPTEADGPKEFIFKVRVTDNGSPSMFAEEQISVTVNELNTRPVLAPIAAKTVNELTPIIFTASATDNDLPAQTLSYSLVGAPIGAAINASTGVFSWTPSEAQGMGAYTFTVRVSDNAATSLSADLLVTVTVNEVNAAPVLASIANKTVNELSILSFTASATDGDIPAQAITYSLAGAPSSAVINPTTGVFTWTPSEAQGQGVYTFKVKAIDNFSTPQAAEQSVTVTVNELNVAPVLVAIGNKTVNVLANLTFTVKANDADLAAQTITYSLTGTVPTGATINAVTGVFHWTPSASQGPQNYSFGIRATDNGTPAMFGEEMITVHVIDIKNTNTAPAIAAIGNKTVNELSKLMFTATATDPDIPAQTLTYSLQGAVPSGAIINPVSGIFSWIPSELQGPNVYTFKVRVTDNGTPAMFAEQPITITVKEVVEISKPITIRLKINNCRIQKCITLNPSTFGLTPPFRYTWSNGQTTSSINVCPNKDVTYTVMIEGAYENRSTSFNVDLKGKGCRGKKPKKNKGKNLMAARSADNSSSISANTELLITKVLIYPNPTSNNLFHVSLKNQLTEPASLLVTDMLGRKVLTQKILKKDVDIDLKGKPKGLYLVHIIVNDKKTTFKVVLQ